MGKSNSQSRQQRRAMQRRSAKQPDKINASSRLTKPAQSPWGALQEDERRKVEYQDNFAPLRNELRELALEREEWAGIPIPIDGERLIIEPSYKYAAIGAIGKDETTADYKMRNIFYSHTKRCDVAVFEEQDGRITHALLPAIHHLGYDLRTLGCSDAWGVEQESNAIRLLGTLVSPRQFKQYMMTGTFIETSKSSGVTYMFRRLRPTVAMRPSSEGSMRILCSLCQHPIGYYADSFAGAMCPSDDVVAHLMMARADEKLFWRRSNQHPAHRPEAGI